MQASGSESRHKPTSEPPGLDESAFLVALLTAVCRPSLWLAPGMLVTAPAVSGAGSGKGLLVRAICTIAFGIWPRSFTTGSERQELDKRLAAELIEAQPALFLDNANGIALRSDLLASVLTERPARVRLLGQTRMVPLNSTAFVAVTGNGLTVTEDLARRFIPCQLDARCEDPELRPFPTGFLDQVEQRRPELLAAALTIWRWGRQNATTLTRGKPLGSFETWAEWSRDPLVTLGCCDPVERIEALKANDPRRQRIGELFRAWWEHHGALPTKASDLAEPVKAIADPQSRGRQYLATFLIGLAGTHAAGFVTRQEPGGKWSAETLLERETRTTISPAIICAPWEFFARKEPGACCPPHGGDRSRLPSRNGPKPGKHRRPRAGGRRLQYAGHPGFLSGNRHAATFLPRQPAGRTGKGGVANRNPSGRGSAGRLLGPKSAYAPFQASYRSDTRTVRR